MRRSPTEAHFAAAVADTGVLNVNAVTNFAGTVTDSGTLNVNAATTFASTVTDNGTLNVNAAATFQGAFVDNSAVNINSGVADFRGSFTGNGTIDNTVSRAVIAIPSAAPMLIAWR